MARTTTRPPTRPIASPPYRLAQDLQPRGARVDLMAPDREGQRGQEDHDADPVVEQRLSLQRRLQ